MYAVNFATHFHGKILSAPEVLLQVGFSALQDVAGGHAAFTNIFSNISLLQPTKLARNDEPFETSRELMASP